MIKNTVRFVKFQSMEWSIYTYRQFSWARKNSIFISREILTCVPFYLSERENMYGRMFVDRYTWCVCVCECVHYSGCFCICHSFSLSVFLLHFSLYFQCDCKSMCMCIRNGKCWDSVLSFHFRWVSFMMPLSRKLKW